MSEFERDGMVWLRGAFDPAGMADIVWDELARLHGIRKEDRSTWGEGTSPRLLAFPKSDVFESFSTPTVQNELARHLGDAWQMHRAWGTLITFPRVGEWTVAGHGWHLDMGPARTSDRVHVVRLFAYLNDVRPGGGGTCVVAGSHRVASAVVRRTGVAAMSSAEIRKALRRDQGWFRELMLGRRDESPGRLERLADEGAEIDGGRVRVVELSGEAGDVVVWHPWLLHAAAPNCADEPRFMLSFSAHRIGYGLGENG